MEYDKKLIILLSTQRSGSTWLADILAKASSGRIAVYGELLLPKTRQWDIGQNDYTRFIDSPYLDITRPRGVYQYLDNLYTRSDRSVAFKLMYSDVRRYPEVIPYILRRYRRIQVIHLIRENYLNTVISLARLRKTRMPHLHSASPEQSAKIRNLQIELNPKEAKSEIDRLRRKITGFHRLFRMLPNEYCTVRYEALASDNQNEADKLFTFLGLTADLHNLQSDLMRLSSGGQQKSLSNYDEIKSAFVGTKYEYLLEQ